MPPLPPPLPTPLTDALLARAASPASSFHVPGHKRAPPAAVPGVEKLLGAAAFRADTTELAGLDVLSSPAGPIAASQAAAAAAYGVAATRYLVGGATAGVVAAVVATCGGGGSKNDGAPKTLLATRAAHQSVLAGAALAGAAVAWIPPPTAGAGWGWLAHPLTAARVDAALADAEARGDAVGAVLVVSPTYYGAVADVPAIAAACAARAVPLIVDEAHGAHFGLHPAFPPASATVGAAVAVAGAHKTLAALTQTALLHCARPDILPRIDAALRALQSSSPSFLLLASLEAAVAAAADPAAWTGPLAAAADAAAAVRAAPGWRLLSDDGGGAGAGEGGWDPLRLTVSHASLSGHAAAAALEAAGAVPELATDAVVVLALGAGSGPGDADALARALAAAHAAAPATARAPPPRPPPTPTRPRLSPRLALFGATERVPAGAAVGRTAGEAVTPYPPGVPLLLPGEAVTAAVLAEARRVVESGGRVVCGDPEVRTVAVVVEEDG